MKMATKIIVGFAMVMAFIAFTVLVSNEAEIITSSSKTKNEIVVPLLEKSSPATTPVRPRANRFLVEEHLKANPRAKYHCQKDNDVCYEEGSPGTSCCNNKCVDLKTDRNNCGSCKNKCKFTDECCNGECVNLWYDKRHCGKCFNKCMTGGYCIYGMCDYA